MKDLLIHSFLSDKTTRYRRLPLGLLSAVLFYITVSTGYWFFAWICLVPLFYLLNLPEQDQSKFGVIGFSFFLSFMFFAWIIKTTNHYTGQSYWMGLVAFLTYSLIYSFFLLTVFTIFRKVKTQGGGISSVLANALILATVWMVMEEVRLYLLKGLPFLDLRLGYAISNNLYSVQWVSVFGVGILSFILVSVNYMLSMFLLKGKSGYPLLLIAVTLVFILQGTGFAKLKLNIESDNLKKWSKVALVTHNLSPEVIWSPESEQDLATLYFDLNHKAVSSQALLIIWTESSIPWKYQKGDIIVGKITSESRSNGTDQLMGVNRPTSNDPGRIYNSAILFSTDGTEQCYDKCDLLSLIEKPLSLGKFEWMLPMLSNTGISIKEGGKRKVVDSNVGSLGPLICNEAILPISISREYNPDLLVVIGNDNWFEHTYIPFLHFLNCRLRALETGKNVLFNLNRGYSGVAFPDGQVTLKEPDEMPSVHTVQVEGRIESHFAARYTFWFIWASCIGMTFLKLLCKN